MAMRSSDAEHSCTSHMSTCTVHSVIMQDVNLCPIHPPHLAAMSSSSPPQPQYWLGKPFIFMYWSGVTADTPPKYCGYGSLGGSHHRCTILKIMYQRNTFIQRSTHAHIHTVLLPVSELVHGHRQVRRELFVAGVGVVVVLRQQVNIMQEDAAPVFISEGLPHPDIQQLGSVKRAVPPLRS